TQHTHRGSARSPAGIASTRSAGGLPARSESATLGMSILLDLAASAGGKARRPAFTPPSVGVVTVDPLPPARRRLGGGTAGPPLLERSQGLRRDNPPGPAAPRGGGVDRDQLTPGDPATNLVGADAVSPGNVLHGQPGCWGGISHALPPP